SLTDKTIVVTGGSRGLGLGLVEALVDQGARVTVVARDQTALAAVERRLGVAVIAADVTDEGAAKRILADVRPEVLVLNAGATPRMGRLDQLSWPDFTAPWETDVKYPSDISSHQSVCGGRAIPIADQAAADGEFRVRGYRRHGIAPRQCCDPAEPAVEKRIGLDKQGANLSLAEMREGGVDLAVIAGQHDRRLHRLQAGCFL